MATIRTTFRALQLKARKIIVTNNHTVLNQLFVGGRGDRPFFLAVFSGPYLPPPPPGFSYPVEAPTPLSIHRHYHTHTLPITFVPS